MTRCPPELLDPSVHDGSVFPAANENYLASEIDRMLTTDVEALVTYDPPDPLRGGNGWATFTLRIAAVTFAIECEDGAGDEDPYISLLRLLEALKADRLPYRIVIDRGEFDTSLAARRTDEPQIVWLTVGNLRNLHLEALVERQVLINALGPAVQELGDADWRMRRGRR